MLRSSLFSFRKPLRRRISFVLAFFTQYNKVFSKDFMYFCKVDMAKGEIARDEELDAHHNLLKRQQNYNKIIK